MWITKELCHRGRTLEVENVVVDTLAGQIPGMNINRLDKALVLKDIEVTNAKKYKNDTNSAVICRTYFLDYG